MQLSLRLHTALGGRFHAPTGTAGNTHAKLLCGLVRPFKPSIENNLVSANEVFLIPVFSFQGSGSVPGMILAKQPPKFRAALREPLAKPLLEPDRQYLQTLAL
jgi:hypothetical protein